MEKIRIAVTGGNGQVGSELKALAPLWPLFTFTFLDIAEIDLSDGALTRTYFSTNEFDFLINCAAYTAVDKAEEEPEKASLVNAHAVKTLAEICLQKQVRMIHISTDYVFSGESNVPLDENEAPSPLSAYGRTKLEGEQHVLAILPNAYIIRTAWVYSTFGKNFVKSIINLAKTREELVVVSDQIGSPTYARDLASAILTIIHNITAKNNDQPGVYHYSSEGVISWYDFAFFINLHFGFPCKIRPIKTAEYKTLAARPKFSLLDKTKIKQNFNLTVPHWSDSLRICLSKIEL